MRIKYISHKLWTTDQFLIVNLYEAERINVTFPRERTQETLYGVYS